MAPRKSDRRIDQATPSRGAQPWQPQRPEQPAATDRQVRPDRKGLAVIPLYVWVLGFVVLLLLLLVASLWLVYALRGQWAESGPTATPILWTPTSAPVPPTATPTPAPTEEPTPTVPAGIAIGARVRVTGTGGSGLSLRDGPGTEYQRMDVAVDGQIFEVVDGPTVAGDVTWWKVRDPDDENRSYWAAANFLEPEAPE